MSVSIDPTNPLRVAGITSYGDRTTLDQDQLEVVYSSDGGVTWSSSIIDSNDDGLGTAELRFDPTLTFDDDGRLYICYGWWGSELGSGVRLVVGVDAENGGASFDNFEVVDGGPAVQLDKWFLATGEDPSTGDPAVYVAYSVDVSGMPIRLSGSNDGGQTWKTPVPISDSGHGGINACPAVGPDGQLYVAWHNVGSGGNTVWLDKDLDGLWGGTYDFGTDSSVRTLVNGGLFNYLVPAQPDRGVATGPVLTTDRSGGIYSGRLYITFIERTSTASNEQDTNVILGHSDDGSSWAFTTIDSSTSTEFLPWVDVDQATGSVNILYYTTHGDTSGNDDVHMRLATSLDGGVNWTVAEATSITSNENEGGDDIYDSGEDYLEYVGLDVHDGTAHGLFSFQPFGSSADQYDLDPVAIDAAFVNSNNTLTITGDDAGTANDTIVVQRASVNSDYLEVLVNNVRQFGGRYDSVGKLVINGGGGNDTITIASGVTIPASISGGSGNDTITGGSGNDTISGGDGTDSIAAGLGSDNVSGDAGSDTIYGDAGADTISGGDDADIIHGGADNNSISGDAGNDTMDAGSGADIMDGGIGTDTADYSTRTANLSISLDGGANDGASGEGDNVTAEVIATGSGADTISAASASYAVTLRGNGGADSLTGGSGNDSLNGAAGNDTLSGGSGNDSISGVGGNDLLLGGAGNDVLDGDDGTDTAGNDTIYGGADDDVIYAGAGSNQLYGEGGDDIFYCMNYVADTVNGGDGYDHAVTWDDELDQFVDVESFDP